MPPLTDEQIAIRKHGIGSSEIAAVCGENPWRNGHDVWLEKRGLGEPFEGNDATWLGNELEPIIARRYYAETGAALIPGPGTVKHPRHEWALSSTDFEHESGRRIVECKYVGMRAMAHWTLEADGAPTYVQLQTQWQMACRGIERADVAVIFGATAEFRIYEFTLDAAIVDALLMIGNRFWHENVLGGQPPPIDGSDAARKVLAALYPMNRKPLAIDEAATEWFDLRARAKADKDAAESAVNLATNKLIEIIGDADGIECSSGITTFKADKNGKRSIRMYPRKADAA